MKKNNFFILFTVLTLIISSIGIASAVSSKLNKKVFSGRVIFVADNYIELKKGKTEIKVKISEYTKFISKDGKESDKNIIAVCQYVDAYYNEQAGTKNLDKIIIKKESDCVK